MSIYVECDQCQKKYRLQEHLAGRRLPCKVCGAEFQVPNLESDVFDDFDDTFAGGLDDQFELDPSSKRRGRQPQSTRHGQSSGWNSRPWIIGTGAILGMLVLLAVLVTSFKWRRDRDDIAGIEQVAAETDADEPFAIGTVTLPKFPELGPPQQTLPGGELIHAVDLSSKPQQDGLPGSRMKMQVYLPPGEHAPGSLSCVLVAPAGTTLLTGNDLDSSDYHDETLPYVQAGMAVVFYSIDGGIDDIQTAADAEVLVAYQKFRAACAGVINGRNALEFVLARLPQVDANRIYTAGHSSAGTLSLLLAQHEPRVKACIAYAPATDVEKGLREVLSDPQTADFFPRLQDFLQQSSPITHSSRLTCPLFLFHARDDSNISWTDTQVFATSVGQSGATPTLKIVAFGEHYDSMIEQGIPQAIAWLRGLPGESGGSLQQHRPDIASSAAGKPADNDAAPDTTTAVPNSVAGGPGSTPVPSRIGTRPPALPSIPGTPPGSRFTRQRPTLPSRSRPALPNRSRPTLPNLSRPTIPNRSRPTLPSRSRPTIPNPTRLLGNPPGLPGATNSQSMFVFQVIRGPRSTDGKNVVDVAQVASQALSTMSRVVPGSVKYDAKTRELTMEIKATSDRFEQLRQESEIRQALLRARIFVGAVRSQVGPPPAEQKPPAEKKPPAEQK